MRRIKVKDTVLVQSGKDKGKKGKVTQILPADDLVVVDGINKMFKHLRSGRKNESGQRVEFYGPIRLAKVALICPKCNLPTRVGFSLVGQSKKRVCNKCHQPIE